MLSPSVGRKREREVEVYSRFVDAVLPFEGSAAERASTLLTGRHGVKHGTTLSPLPNPQTCCVPGYVSGYAWYSHACVCVVLFTLKRGVLMRWSVARSRGTGVRSTNITLYSFMSLLSVAQRVYTGVACVPHN